MPVEEKQMKAVEVSDDVKPLKGVELSYKNLYVVSVVTISTTCS